jgi:hypothetical protein
MTQTTAVSTLIGMETTAVITMSTGAAITSHASQTLLMVEA